MAQNSGLLNKLKVILALKCPRCHQGDMFEHSFIQKPAKFSKMHDRCPVCGQHFQPEPGFYFGAMYFSYAFNVAIIVGIFIALNILFDRLPITTLLLSTVLPAILFMPVNFRISRALMLHLFGGIRYDKKYESYSSN